ncbi:alginate export family protein [Methylobacter sp. S3L5C]|uniref:alginate export family protein n=1 Tax=Methylobacter sp. S3L5C TaxID=2839024 RepID=UPI00352F482C
MDHRSLLQVLRNHHLSINNVGGFMPRQQKKIPLSVALLTLSVASHSALAGVTQEVEDALNFYHYGKNGAVKIDLNTRYENVNQGDVMTKPIGGVPAKQQPDTANAVTSRLRLGLLSPVFHGLQGYAEYEGVYAMDSNYNSTVNGKSQYSTVADPYVSELDQLWLSYAGFADTIIKGGRQRIKLDDDRFIGNVGWRQLEQTYDSVLITHNNQQLFGLTVNVGYMGNVKTFTSTTENINAPILNVNYKLGDYGNLVGYGYWLGYTEQENYNKSNQTYGLRVTNYQKPGDSFKVSDNYGLLYTAEWSIQSDYQNSLQKYTVNRFNLMGGLTAHMFTFQGAMEQLDGVGQNKTFITPLGTNHAFQGWADLFLVTPKDGIRDVFGTMITSLDKGSVALTGVYHAFYDDTGSVHYGDEWDFMATKKFGKHYSVLAKYAYYNADQYNTDTQKIWLQGNISF